MDADELDESIQAAFDARRDPLADPGLAAALARSDRLERVVALRAALSDLPEALRERPRPGRRVIAALAAAALLLVAVGFERAAPEASSYRGDSELVRRYAIAPAVLEYRVSSATRSEDRSESITRDSSGRVERSLRTAAAVATSSVRPLTEALR